MTNPKQTADVQGNNPEATPDAATADQAKGKGPWYDDLVNMGLEGEQLEAADKYMREQQGRMTQLEQKLAEFKPFEDVPEETRKALEGLVTDMNADPRSTYLAVTEIAKQAGIDPAEVLGITGTTDDADDSEDEDLWDDDDDDEIDSLDLDSLPDEVKKAVEWMKSKQTEEEIAAFDKRVDQISQESDFYVKDDEGEVIKDADGNPLSAFNRDLYIMTEANYGPEAAKKVYMDTIYPGQRALALANYTPPDSVTEPEPLTDGGGNSPAEPRNETLYEISKRIAQQNRAARAGS